MSNQAVADFRLIHPDEQRSDDDLTTWLASARPDMFNQYPDAVADYTRIQNDFAKSLLGPMDYVKQVVGSPIRAFAATEADLPKAIGTGSLAIARKLNLPAIQFDGGVHLVNTKDLAPEESPGFVAMTKLGESIEAIGNKLSPDEVPALQDSLWATKIPSTFGSIAGFMLGGWIAKGLMKGSIKAIALAAGKDALEEALTKGTAEGLAKVAALKIANAAEQAAIRKVHLLAAGTLGAAASGVSAYQDALAHGATQGDAENAFFANLPVGATYGLPVAELLKPGSTYLSKMAVGMGVGVGTMDAQQVLSNLIAKKLYDPTRDWTAGLAETTTAGGIATAALSLLSHKLMGKAQAPATDINQKQEAVRYSQRPGDPVWAAANPEAINPMSTYEPDAATQSKVAELVRRQVAGEISPAIDVRATLNPIEANLYDQQKATATQPPPVTQPPLPDVTETGVPQPAAVVPPAASRNPDGSVGAEAAAVPDAAQAKLDAIRAGATGTPTETSTVLPDLSKKRADALSQKPAHELTPGEFVQVATKKLQETGHQVPSEAELLAAHQYVVEKAVNNGADIPDRVLKAYPDLERQVAAAPPETPQAAATPPTSINSPNPENAELMNPQVAGLLNMVDFDKAKLVSGEKGVGQKNAPAFLATNDPEKLYQTVRAKEGNKNFTTMLGAFEAKDGTLKVGPAYDNRGRRVALAGEDGKPVSMTYDAAVKAGYKLVAALKTKESHHSSDQSVAVTYSAAEWAAIRAEAESRMAAAKSTAAAMEQHITGVTMPVEAGAESKLGEVGHVPDTELPAKTAKAKPLEVVSDEEIKRLSKLVEVERFGKDQAALLWDEIGTGPIDTDSALSTLESLLADPTDGPRLAARSLIFELEERNPNAPKNEIIELAAEVISRASDKAADESDFARRIVQAGTGDTSKEAGTETVSAGATAPGLEHPNAGANGAAIPPSAVGGGREQSVAATPADGAVGGWSSLKAARLLQIRWKQYLAEGARLKKEESTASAARFSERQPSQYLASDSDIVGRLNAVLDAGRTNGVDIKVLQAALGEKESGISTPGTVVLFLHDQYHPSTDNLVLGFHEIGHELFRLLRLNPAMEEAYHRGIEKLSVPEGFTPKLGGGVNVRYVTAEETLVERVARNLEAEGFNPNQAQSIAQRLWRFMQRIYMRASMAIQAGLLGQDHVNPELAEAYFENRMRSFLAGDLQPMSFISFLGGAKLTPAQQGDTFHTGTGFAAQFNGDTGMMEYREALPSTVEAMKFNQRIAQEAVRYSERQPGEETPLAFKKTTDPHMVGREFNTAPKVKEDIGAYNALHEMHQAAWRVLEKIGLSKPGYTFEHLLEHFLGEDTSATAKIEARNADLVANGFPPVDPTLRWNDPSMPETSQMDSADKGLRLGAALRTKLSERRTREDAFLKTADEQINRKATQVAEVTKNYMNTDLQLTFAKTEVGRLLNQLRDDFRQGTNAAAKEGMLSQVIRQIDGKKPDKAYVDAINQLYKRLATDPQGRFIDMLQKVADLGVDWKNTTAKEGLEFIKDIVAHTDADLEPLQQRALASIAVAFAKTNEHAMGLLELARSNAVEERAKVTEILRKAVENTADAIPNARKLAKSLPRLGKLADRLLTKLEDVKAEMRQHIDERERAKTFTQLHDAFAPVLADQLRQLEQAIGKKGTDFQANDGATILIALKPTSTDAEVLSNTGILQLDGVGGNSKLNAIIIGNNAWLAAKPESERGAAWNTVAEQTRKMEQVVSFAQHEQVIKPSFINQWFGNLSNHARGLGLPSMSAVGERFTRYLYQRDSRTPTASRLGGEWATKEANLMRALGVSKDNIPAFRRVVYDPILDFYNSHPEVLASFKNGKEAVASLLPKVKEMLMQNPDLRERLKDPAVWKQVEAYVWQTYENVSEIFKAHGGLDLFFQEIGPDGKAFERHGLGHPLFTMPQQVRDHVLRMYQTMRGAGWLGSKEDGKFKAGEASAEYEKDPEAFSSKVDTQMNAEILRDFVTPLTRKIRSAFYGPKQTDGIERLAGISNVTKACVASDGSLVKFAEHLYELESDGKNIIESQTDFVGKTLEGFQGFFDNLHNQFKDYDAAVQNGIQLPPRMLMDARTSESYPSEWLEHMPLGHQNMQVIFSRLAAESAFGRNHAGMGQDLQNGIKNFTDKAVKWDHLVELVRTNNLFAKGKALDAAIKKAVESDTEAKEKGWSYQALRQARENLRMARKVKGEWLSLMKIDGGVALELRPWLQLLGADAGLTVQGPSTSFLHFTTFIQAFSKLGLSMPALRVIKESLSGTAATGLGSFMQMFGNQISWKAAQTARLLEIGYVPSDALQGFNNAWRGALRDEPKNLNPASRLAFRASVTVRTVLSQGIGHAGEGAKTAYPSFKLLHAPFSWFGQIIDAGSVHGFMSGFSDMVERAVDYYKSNPGDRTNPNFEFKEFTDLGYRKGFFGFGSEKDAYRFFRDSMENRGINLETVARDVLQRRERGENVPPINNDQFRAIAGIVRQEVSLDAQGSRPTWLTTNPVLRFGSPLLGWPITKVHDWWKSAFRNPDMTLKNENQLKSLYYGMLPYLAIVPASIALAYLKDQFNAGVVGKKANREDPFTSFKGMLDALAWTGTLGGLEGDMLNAFVNGDTQRPFDVDHRVFLVSSMRGLWDATRNWAVQGAVIPDYATVLRPASQSLGGSGYLQYADIINHALSLDNVEARQNARINAGNYLRVAGRGLGMDVRVSGGGAVLSNPLRPLIGQMVSATYANDALDFRDAYSRALAEAVTEKRAQAKTWQQKQNVMKDAKDAVQRAYAGRNPLRTVFASERTEQEYQQILSSLDDSGRAAVSDAMRLFNHYGQQVESSKGVGITPSLGRKAARTGTPFNLDQVRRASVGMSTGTPFNLDRVRSLSVGM